MRLGCQTPVYGLGTGNMVCMACRLDGGHGDFGGILSQEGPKTDRSYKEDEKYLFTDEKAEGVTCNQKI